MTSILSRRGRQKESWLSPEVVSVIGGLAGAAAGAGYMVASKKQKENSELAEKEE